MAKLICVLLKKNSDLTFPRKFITTTNEKFVLVCSQDYFKKVSTDNFTYILQQSDFYTRKLFEQNESDKKFKSIEVSSFNLEIELCKKSLGILLRHKFWVEYEILNDKFVIEKSLRNNNDIIYGCYCNQATITKSTREF